MTTPPLQFIRRGQTVALSNVPPDRTLLALLREDLGETGTKEGCGEGDCGACTVVLGAAHGDRVRYSAVNSCIRLAHSIAGLALWTVEDLTEDPLLRPGECIGNNPHPAQQAMLDCHGTQCGFCTPGFVMSLFAMYQNRLHPGRPVTPITRDLAREELSGNLCRCTGYRPILDAAEQMTRLYVQPPEEAQLLQALAHIEDSDAAPAGASFYAAPRSLPALLAARAAFPQAQIVAGCTDVGLWINKQHRQYAQLIDVTRAAPLQQIVQHADHIAIGAAATLTDAFAALVAQWPELRRFATRFAALQVRNTGTLGGNVANGSPIGDSMPLLIALRAQVVLGSTRGERQMALEAFYTGYRQTVLAPDELLLRILVPRPADANIEHLQAYKVAKRFDDDISTVCLVLNLSIADGMVQSASIGAGGVAATPARARQTEAALVGQPWNPATLAQASAALQAEFRPISDMRASGAYRSAVLAGLLQRFWLVSQGGPNLHLDLEDLRLETTA